MRVYSFVLLQGEILGKMFLLGMVMGLLYDFLRIFRRLFRVSRWFVQISDLFYWPMVILLLWAMQNELVEGVVRFCQLFFVAAGMLCYYIILSPWVIWGIYTPLHFCAKQRVKFCRHINRKVESFFKGKRLSKDRMGKNEQKTADET